MYFIDIFLHTHIIMCFQYSVSVCAFLPISLHSLYIIPHTSLYMFDRIHQCIHSVLFKHIINVNNIPFITRKANNQVEAAVNGINPLELLVLSWNGLEYTATDGPIKTPLPQLLSS